jgi:hypothetical protein
MSLKNPNNDGSLFGIFFLGVLAGIGAFRYVIAAPVTAGHFPALMMGTFGTRRSHVFWPPFSRRIFLLVGLLGDGGLFFEK